MSESLQTISPIDINQDGRDFFSPSPILEEGKLQSVKEQVWKLTFCALVHSLTHSLAHPLTHSLTHSLYPLCAPGHIRPFVFYQRCIFSMHQMKHKV